MKMKMYDDLEEILITKEQIAEKIEELGRQITADYADDPDPILLVCILKGSVAVFADLMRQIDHACLLDFMVVKSYEDTKSSGDVRIIKDADNSVTGKNVIIVEDIIDSGRTLSNLKAALQLRSPKSLKICTLLDKKDRRLKEITLRPDYCGFSIPDKFVVGYGLDYNQRYRTLPDIGVLKPEIYENLASHKN